MPNKFAEDTKFIKVVIKEEDKILFRQIAQSNDETMSSMLRNYIQREIKRYKRSK